MISPETLRRYPFFGPLSPIQLQAIADLSEEVALKKGTTVFEEGRPADKFYILERGSIDFYYESEEEFHPKTHKEFSVGEVNPGEPFAISALLEPHILKTTAKASQDCQVIEIDGVALRELMEHDHEFAYRLMIQLAKALFERLANVRVQLAAAYAP